jgi:prepilin-type N-terminal cleavage/methylation domain-containing protein
MTILFGLRRRGFTMVEVAAAVLLLGILLSSVMVLLNRYLEVVVDMRLRQQAFEMARANMETLLSADKLADLSEFGESERYPEIEWSTTVEPFTEPVKDRMWIRAVCTAGYTDSQGEKQAVELEHWITSLTAEQIKQILNQQKAMGEYYNLIKAGYMTDAQLATQAFLQQQGLDVDAYRELVEAHRRLKLEYLQQHTTNFDQRAFDAYVDQLDDAENAFLRDLGMDFAAYNKFALDYEPPERNDDDGQFETDPDELDPDNPDPDNTDPEDLTRTTVRAGTGRICPRVFGG